jgi:hypothetical protein
MGLTAAFQKGADALFSAFGDIKTAVTYSSQDQPVDIGISAAVEVPYDPSTGLATPTSTDYSINVIIEPISLLTRPEEGYLGNTVQDGDKKIMINGYNIAFTPQPGDKITQGALVWSVLSVTSDPAAAVYTVHARRV